MFGLRNLISSGVSVGFSRFPKRNVVNDWSVVSPKGLLKVDVLINGGSQSRAFARKESDDDPVGRLVALDFSTYDSNVDETKSSHPIIILHDILVSKENWSTMASQLNRKTGRKVITVDARNHGTSPRAKHLSYEFMSCDLIYFMRNQKIQRATLIGHSMGGRVAMMVAMRYPMLVQSLIVVDISPYAASPNMLAIKQLLRDIKNLDLDRHYTLEEARRQATAQLKEKKYGESIIDFLINNIVPNEFNTNWRWKFNLDCIIKNFEREIVFFPIVNAPCHVRTLFLGGTDSDYLIRQEEAEIKTLFPSAEFTYVQGAGHFIHLDKPVEFLDVVTSFVDQDPTRLQEDVEKHPLGEPVAVEFVKYDQKPGNKTDTPVIILHGLLGSKQNWNSVAGQLNRKTGRTVYALDARNHGDSPHTELFTYELMVCDLIVFMRKNQISKATIIGHSMGGRVGMMLSMMYPMLVESLIVVDISPIGTSPNMMGIKKLLNDIQNLDLDPHLVLSEARRLAAVQLREKVKDERVIAFILTNLVANTGRSNWRWKFNLDSIIKNFDREVAIFPIVKLPCCVRTLFVGGADSDYLKPEDAKHIKKLFMEAHFIYIPGAGHWVHAEKPAEFLEVVSEFMNKDFNE